MRLEHKIAIVTGGGTGSKKLEGKIALITGGSRGIGAAIAKRLAADGANVAITYTKGADAAASVVKEIERAGRKAIAIQADATDAGAVEAAVEKTVATFGRLDVLVNNAGTRSEEHTSELQSPCNLVCRLLLEKKKKKAHEKLRAQRTQRSDT